MISHTLALVGYNCIHAPTQCIVILFLGGSGKLPRSPTPKISPFPPILCYMRILICNCAPTTRSTLIHFRGVNYSPPGSESFTEKNPHTYKLFEGGTHDPHIIYGLVLSILSLSPTHTVKKIVILLLARLIF